MMCKSDAMKKKLAEELRSYPAVKEILELRSRLETERALDEIVERVSKGTKFAHCNCDICLDFSQFVTEDRKFDGALKRAQEKIGSRCFDKELDIAMKEIEAARLEWFENEVERESREAFKRYVELAKDPKTPAAVKERIYAKLIDLDKETGKL